MASPRRIDVHFHHIPPFYSEAVYEAGRGPAIGKYPDWTPQLALELMDRHGIEVALTSLAQPGVGFGSETSAQALARRCNDYAADLIARWPAPLRSVRHSAHVEHRRARSTRSLIASTSSRSTGSRCSRATARNSSATHITIR